MMQCQQFLEATPCTYNQRKALLLAQVWRRSYLAHQSPPPTCEAENGSVENKMEKKRIEEEI